MSFKKAGFFITILVFLLFLGQVGNVKAQTSIMDQNSQAGSTPPAKPIVNNISNKDLYISGTAEINSIVHVRIGSEEYSQKLEDTTDFKIYLNNNQPLKEGTTVIVYVTDNLEVSSSLVTLKVIDIIPPKVPSINKVLASRCY